MTIQRAVGNPREIELYVCPRCGDADTWSAEKDKFCINDGVKRQTIRFKEIVKETKQE